MKRKHLVAGLIGISLILGWNIFLIQRDQDLYSVYNYSDLKK